MRHERRNLILPGEHKHQASLPTLDNRPELLAENEPRGGIQPYERVVQNQQARLCPENFGETVLAKLPAGQQNPLVIHIPGIPPLLEIVVLLGFSTVAILECQILDILAHIFPDG